MRVLDLSEPVHVSAVDLAQLLGINDNQVAKLAPSGVFPRIPSPENRRAFLYPLLECVQAFSRHLQSDMEKARKDFLLEKSRTQAAVRAKAELAVELGRGDLVPREEFLSTLAGRSAAIGNVYLREPGDRALESYERAFKPIGHP
jgi:hypothetical protein